MSEDKENKRFDDVPRSKSWGEIADTLNRATETFVRIVGGIFMLIGIAVAIPVIQECWKLYENPVKVSTLAAKIEMASGLNKALNDWIARTAHESKYWRPISEEAKKQLLEKEREDRPAALDFTFFFTWGLVLCLLALIARIGLWALGEGGKLALGGRAEQKFAKAIAHEIALAIGYRMQVDYESRRETDGQKN